jgi:hypothetical protein
MSAMAGKVITAFTIVIISDIHAAEFAMILERISVE